MFLKYSTCLIYAFLNDIIMNLYVHLVSSNMIVVYAPQCVYHKLCS